MVWKHCCNGFRGTAGALVVACVVSMTACTSSSRATPPDAAPEPDAAPDASATCVPRQSCSIVPTTAPTDALYQQLGCGQTFDYESKDPLSRWQGTGSFCPDTPENRKLLHDNMKLGYLPGYCDTCLGVPANQVFVIWKLAPPNCPDQCPEPF